MWSEYAGIETLRFVCVGTLDDPATIPPYVHILRPLEAAVGDTARGRSRLRGVLRLAKAVSLKRDARFSADVSVSRNFFAVISLDRM
jgi:hypothetical protein